ncbi:MAG: hypothetical protein ABEI86_12020 [Halobacteriaceae archaeon]
MKLLGSPVRLETILGQQELTDTEAAEIVGAILVDADIMDVGETIKEAADRLGFDSAQTFLDKRRELIVGRLESIGFTESRAQTIWSKSNFAVTTSAPEDIPEDLLPAQITVNEVDVIPETVTAGQEAPVVVSASNSGSATGSKTFEVFVGGDKVRELRFRIEAQETQNRRIQLPFMEPGRVTVEVNGTTDTVRVTQPEQPQQDTDTGPQLPSIVEQVPDSVLAIGAVSVVAFVLSRIARQVLSPLG